MRSKKSVMESMLLSLKAGIFVRNYVTVGVTVPDPESGVLQAPTFSSLSLARYVSIFGARRSKYDEELMPEYEHYQIFYLKSTPIFLVRYSYFLPTQCEERRQQRRYERYEGQYGKYNTVTYASIGGH